VLKAIEAQLEKKGPASNNRPAGAVSKGEKAHFSAAEGGPVYFIPRRNLVVMRSALTGVAAVLGLALLGGPVLFSADDDDKKPKYNIPQVMQKAHGKAGLLKKVAGGKADQEEKDKLVELYVALSKNEPPRGDKESCKKKTEALVKGSRAVAKDEEGGLDKLKKAANCKGCHDAHRGEDE
jgi:hypothetical protein